MQSKAKRSGRLVLVAATLGLTVFGAAPAARAACVSAEVRVWRSGSSTPTYVGGQKQCVAPTPWNAWMEFGFNYRDDHVPYGYPNGVGATVWIPGP